MPARALLGIAERAACVTQAHQQQAALGGSPWKVHYTGAHLGPAIPLRPQSGSAALGGVPVRLATAATLTMSTPTHAAEGRPYFYNVATGVTQWNAPA